MGRAVSPCLRSHAEPFSLLSLSCGFKLEVGLGEILLSGPRPGRAKVDVCTQMSHMSPDSKGSTIL